ncbi:MAG: LSM domain protein, partial [Methanobacteriales archaeon]|nr:LSM domain protein [Methanobacteriales archaeon]MBC7119442.1 LSM domain protein [Methanobacteriaceae archaeon]
MVDKINRQFLKFKGKRVLVTLKNDNEHEGRLISIDN